VGNGLKMALIEKESVGRRVACGCIPKTLLFNAEIWIPSAEYGIETWLRRCELGNVLKRRP